VEPKGRERRLARQRVDRSHRGVVVRGVVVRGVVVRGVVVRGVVVRQRRPPPLTPGEKAVLVLSLAFIFAAVALALVMLLP
jgi:hypothetical protein